VNPAMRARLAMTLAAWLAAFAVVMALLAVFGDLLATLPMAARAAVISGVLVTVMVNLVMPRLAPLINRWTGAPRPGTAPAGRTIEHSDQDSVPL
jgi:antibiotic biosynthesis monooxygenase (ABM) superfamily enzyme